MEINVEHTINSGQVFLWEKFGTRWYGINGNDVLSVDEIIPYEISSYQKTEYDLFRQTDHFDKIIKSISKDKIIKNAIKQFPGLRLMRQDPFQCYISFIVSSNSSIQNIRLTLQRLAKIFVKRASLMVKQKEIDFDYLKKLDYNTAKGSLLQVFGIGNKVADCILLFAIDQLES